MKLHVQLLQVAAHHARVTATFAIWNVTDERDGPPSAAAAALEPVEGAVDEDVRIASAAAKRWPRPSQGLAGSVSTSRRYASWTRAVVWKV